MLTRRYMVGVYGRRWAWVIAVAMAGCSAGKTKDDKTPPAEARYPVPPMVTDGETVAAIGPVTITTKELEKRINTLSSFARMQLQDPRKKMEYVKNEVQLEVLAQEAWRRNLQNDPRVLQQYKQLLAQQLIQVEMKRLADSIQVSDGEALKAYEENKSEYVKEPTIRLAHIVRYVETEGERKKADRLLRSTKKKVLARERKNDYRAFANAAKKSSEDETTRNAGGDLQFLSRAQLTERYGQEVAQYMFDKVKVGDLAVANAPNAVVLFKKTGERRGFKRGFDQVKAQIRGQLLQRKRNDAFKAYVEKLQQAQNVKVYLDRATDVELKPTGVTKPGGKK